MAYLLVQGGRTDYNYREYYLDTVSELKDLDVNKCCPGSVAYIIKSGDVYILSNELVWEVQ